MKHLLLLLLILCAISTSGQDTTKYKPGFTFYDDYGTKITLVKWEEIPLMSWRTIHRWRARFERGGYSALGWTDDCWIDLYTGKAYYDRRNHRIVYYDSLNIQQ